MGNRVPRSKFLHKGFTVLMIKPIDMENKQEQEKRKLIDRALLYCPYIITLNLCKNFDQLRPSAALIMDYVDLKAPIELTDTATIRYHSENFKIKIGPDITWDTDPTVYRTFALEDKNGHKVYEFSIECDGDIFERTYEEKNDVEGIFYSYYNDRNNRITIKKWSTNSSYKHGDVALQMRAAVEYAFSPSPGLLCFYSYFGLHLINVCTEKEEFYKGIKRLTKFLIFQGTRVLIGSNNAVYLLQDDGYTIEYVIDSLKLFILSGNSDLSIIRRVENYLVFITRLTSRTTSKCNETIYRIPFDCKYATIKSLFVWNELEILYSNELY